MSSNPGFDAWANKDGGNSINQSVIHGACPRAWVYMDGNPDALINGFNIASVIDSGSGLTDAVMANAMLNSTFVATANFCQNTTTTNNDKGHSGNTPQTSGRWTASAFNAGTLAQDMDIVQGVVCGDQS